MFDGFDHIVRENEPLAPFTRLNIGGDAQYFAEPTNREELVGIVVRCQEKNIPIRLIGSGSNLLVSDEGVEGLAMHLGAAEFGAIEVTETGLVAGGGARLSQFVSVAVREGFAGPEQMVGLPGTIGGALHNNTGAHGVDIGMWVKSAEVLTRTGEVKKRTADSMSFSYRQSSLNELVILTAEFEFEKESPAELTKAMQKLWIARRANQQGPEQRSAYMFQDSGSETASEIIQSAGLKDTTVGGVSLVDGDPNFFVTEPGSTSGQVVELIESVKQQVKDKLDVELETAIQIW
jgi:UDP-N-acetylmuramate dehydrogenase